MNDPKIKILIDQRGQFTVEVNGVVGQGCEALTKALEKELGSVSATQKKAEYFVKPATSVVSQKL